MCYHRIRKAKQYDDDVLDEILPSYECRIEEDPSEDYELLVDGLEIPAEQVSVPQTKSSDGISTTTKELLEKGMDIKINSSATHLTRLTTNVSCRRSLQEDVHRHEQKKFQKYHKNDRF
ncbi:hypothetical protein KIN20_014727 [Parelaphostrongylus tenuis]|uniref:Uncharacterized protein n=1 Tax=Parelaphostrongylus tenuis TaxID=148309 RepID=A0AAD5N3J8_PARTN|nr:hypothetical protein KIN20_014727 [Parelaphostrongylus tenuis]